MKRDGWDWLDKALDDLKPGAALIIGTDEGDLLVTCGDDGSLTIEDVGEGGSDGRCGKVHE